MDQQNQSQPVQGAVEQLAQTEQQGVAQNDLKRKALMQQFEQAPNQQSAISQALGQLGDKSTAGKIGGALNTNNYSGLCLKWVDDQTGNSARQPTAFADYQQNAASGNIKTSGTPPKGARIYFAPTPDNTAGHIMLSNGDGTGTGATTSQGIKTFNIKSWENYAGQQYIGWAPPNSS